ncbi:hypothetical protein CRE_17768 [Caenorhabditis remanei]|uniref:Uncharacterized protein n=1 Tax=Caenorhabditis remanei TaxID=31234 RepID=E3NTU1_CAERE|nr:hypothetical protein CRE_17768 [Caenorhabditis remanei]
MKNWANFTNGILTIHENLIEKRKKENNQNITCVYTEIIAGEELSNGTFLVQSSKKEITIEPAIPTRINLEQFVVFCRDPSGYHFYNKTFFNFLPKLEKFSVRESEFSNGLIILSVSGMSHNQAMRHLKQSLKFAAENDFISFSMFNQETNNNWGNLMKSFGNQEKIWESVRKINGSPTFLHTDSPKFSKMFGNQFDFHSNLYHNFNRQHFGHVNNCITDGSVFLKNVLFRCRHLNFFRLITNADVYETFLDLISKWNDSIPSSFGNSLLETQISRNKTCTDSEISDENCICSKVVKHETVKRFGPND